jgi:hypothetical protein
MSDAEAVFVPEGDLFVPTALARGPWSKEAQHGGAPGALLARAVERFEGGEGAFVARLTIELLRPVPISPLALRTRFARPGRKVQLVEASLFAGDVEVARCVGLRMRRADLPPPDDLPPAPPPRGPGAGVQSMPPWAEHVAYDAFHTRAVEHRFVAGTFAEPGPATDWIRLRVPLVLGEENSPLCRVAAAADFGNGVSWVLHRKDGWEFLNPDLTIVLHRHPEGEWVCIDSTTWVGPHGTGVAESRLFDESGAIGHAAQTLLIEKRA